MPDRPPSPARRPAGRPRPRVAVLLAALGAVLALSGVTVGVVLAASPAVGHDVSYPQCGGPLPTTGSFGLVGVNGGLVSTANPCLATQYAWASRLSGGASLYVNTGNPGAISTFYWPANGARDPALCRNRTSPADPGCAYDYGWHGALDSLRIARTAAGSAVTARAWWLDVETANSWNGTTTANAAALQGAVDALRGSGIASVGVYSTGYQWGQITGGYSRSTAASYRAAWAPSFTPRFPLEAEPVWMAALGSRDDALSLCSSSFTGGPTMLAQYTDGRFDGDVMCGGATAPAPAPAPTTSPRPTTTTPRATTTTPRPTTPTTPTPTTPTPTTPTTTAAPTTTPPTTAAPTATPGPTATTATGAPAPGAPAATALTAVPGNRSVALSWAAPAGLPPRTTWTVTRAGPGPGGPAVVARGVPGTSWTDTAVVNDATYAYSVAADGPGGPGTPTPPVTVTPSASPGPPTAVVAVPAARGVTLTWRAPLGTGGSPVTRYLVLRSAVPGRESPVAVAPCSTAGCAFTDVRAPAGAPAWYRVVAINDRGVRGLPSDEVTATAG